LDSWEAQLFDEFSLQILDVACNSSNLLCLGYSSLEVLWYSLELVFQHLQKDDHTFLANICHEADNIVALLNQPSH